ncbi:unnamed protein product [Closterium sp. Naga37s-1]|nr:unnamed protein product [Closterium sp. Naga37s-1]
MLKLFWKRMDEAAEGVGVGGGAGHEGGGEGAPRVVVEYSYEEEEEIEEDASRQAQHGVSGPGGNADEQEGSSSESSSGSSSNDESIEHDGEGLGLHPGWTERTEKHGVALGERVDEQQAMGDDWDVEEQEGGAAGQDFGTGVQQQEGGAAAQEGGVGGQQQEGVCGDAVNGVTEERKLLEGARSKLDEMSGKIIEGVAVVITKASEDAVEKQLKLVEERLVASVVKGIEKAVKEDLFYSTLPPESMKELKDIGLGKKGGKGVVVGEKSGAPNGQVASAGKGAMEKRGAPTPSGGAAGKGVGEKWGDPSQVAVAAGLLSKTKADSAAQLGIAGRPVEPVGKRPSSVLDDVSLSQPDSPPPGPRPRSPSASKKRQAVTKSTKRAAEATESSDVEKASTVVAARHEKSKKPKVIGYAPPPPPDDQGKMRGCKAPFKGPGMMSRKGKPVSEQTVGSRKWFLGTFETEADQKFCTAICWRVYFPDIDLKEYEGFTAQDEKDWKVYLDAAARMPTGVWSMAQEQGECRLDE